MVHKIGTTTGNIQVGTYSQGGGLGVAGGSTKSQTILAASAQPPKLMNEGIEIVFVALAGLVPSLLVFAALSGVSPDLAVVLACIVAGAIWVVGWLKIGQPMMSKRKAEHGAKYATWMDTWVCLRCGTSFEVSA